MKKNGMIAVLVAACALVFAGGAKESQPAAADSKLSGTYTFGGSTTIQPIADGVITALKKANPDLNINYEAPGSSGGIKGLLAGTFSLAGSSREVTQAEKDKGCTVFTIAKDAICIVVNKDIPLANLSRDELAKIFAGTITNWKELGGKDEAIVVVNRDEASGTYSSFKELVMDKAKLTFTKNAVVSKENGEVAAKVAGTPGAIGYVGLGFVQEVTRAGGKSLSIDGVQPSSDKTYPISRELYAVTNGNPGTVEKAFLDYVVSPRGAVIVKDAGFVPAN